MTEPDPNDPLDIRRGPCVCCGSCRYPRLPVDAPGAPAFIVGRVLCHACATDKSITTEAIRQRVERRQS